MGVCVPVTMNDTRRSNVQSLAARVSLENVPRSSQSWRGWPEEAREACCYTARGCSSATEPPHLRVTQRSKSQLSCTIRNWLIIFQQC